MKKILNIIVLLSLLCLVYPKTQIALFNFNSATYDLDDNNSVNLSEKISSSFIDLMKSDMEFIDVANFITTRQLDKKLLEIRKSLLNELKIDMNNSIARVIPRSRITEIVGRVSDGNLNQLQLESLTDSLISLVSTSTKDIAKSMLLSNTENMGQTGEITISDLYNFIDNITHESIWKSTFSSLIASSKNDFGTNITVTGEYSIEGSDIRMDLFIYDLSDLKMIGTVSSQSSIKNINVLIKDLEFKLLSEIDILLNDDQKAELCRYNVDEFSKSNNSLYFSNIFLAEDMKELKYRMQFDDTFDLITSYYRSFISGLMENKIRYNIKFYGDDKLYRVYSTESVNDSTFFVNVLNDNWSNKVGVSDNLHSNKKRKPSKVIAEINYSVVQAIQFEKEGDSFIDTLKQISIYSFIVVSGFLLAHFL